MSGDLGRFVAWAVLSAGVAMVGLCGLCTVAAAGMTLPSIFGGKSDAVYAWMLLVPSIGFGGLAMCAGAVLARSGEQALPPGPRRIRANRLAAILEITAGGFLACVSAGLALWIVGAFAISAASDGDDTGAWILNSAVTLVIGGIGVAIGARLARAGLRARKAGLAPQAPP